MLLTENILLAYISGSVWVPNGDHVIILANNDDAKGRLGWLLHHGDGLAIVG